MRNLSRLLFALFLFFQLVACEKIDNEVSLITLFSSNNEYIAVFGDIQYLDDPFHIGIYQTSVNWLIKQINEGMKLNCVLSTGDLTENNSLEEWGCFQKSMKQLSGIVPYYTIIGDHDYTWDEGGIITDRKDSHFNDYINFPLSVQKIVDRYEEERMDNIIVENTVQGKSFNLVLLEFGPRKEVVQWADAYLKSHPSEKFVIMTHEYLEKGGNRRTQNLMMVSRLRNTSYTKPEELWDGLIRCNNNIICVLCGHVGGLYAVTVEKNDFGRDIPQIHHNIQSEEFRYDNWLMLWEVKPQCDSVSAFIFNTRTGAFYNNKKTLFSFAI